MNLASIVTESKHGKGQLWQFLDTRDFHPRTKAILVAVGRCESCGGTLSQETLRCVSYGHDEGIWIPDEQSLEQVELVLGEEKRRNKNHQRIERRREAMAELPGFHRESDLKAILQAQDGCCYYCGVKIADGEVRRDHLKPLNATNSSNWPSNIVLACYPCNRNKSDSSANIYWCRIQQEKGAAWVAEQKKKNLAVTLLARELTKVRKKELTRICLRIAENFKLEIDRLISHQLLKAPSFEYPSINYDKNGILIYYLGVKLQLPPNSHECLSKKDWIKKEAPKLLDALLSVSSSIGSVSLAPEMSRP